MVQKFKTNSQGRFYFNVDHHQTKRYVIRINNTFTELYLQPDSEYKIIIPSESIEVIPYFSGREIELLFIDLDTNDINYKIGIKELDKVIKNNFDYGSVLRASLYPLEKLNLFFRIQRKLYHKITKI